MEDHGHGSSHPLLQSPGGAATLAYAWGYQPSSGPFDEHADTTGGCGDDQQLNSCAFSTAPDPELRRALVRALAELHASRAAHQAELRRMESEAARLVALVSSAAAERDELRRHCHSLLLLLHHQAQAAPPPTPSINAGVLSGGGGGGGGGSGGSTAAAVIMNENAPGAAVTYDDDDTELEMALARRLPEKGHLVEAVVSAGPLLQTLLLAGPLPRWRHPPPPAPADIPPFNPGRQRQSQSPLKADASNSFSSASAGSSSPDSNCSGGPPPPVAHAIPSFHMSPFCM